MASMTTPLLDKDGVGTASYASLGAGVKKALEEIVAAGEKIRVIVLGAREQAMVGTDRRVFVCKPGSTGASLGAGVTAWRYENLAGVQLQKGFLTDAVVLRTRRRTRGKTSYWGEKGDDPFTADNAIPIADASDQVRTGVAFLSQLIALAHTTPPRPVPMVVADRLRNLADLRDRGILTEHEFQAAKTRILDNA
jgi:Short C-terminal domain